jgi:hypothetical protein
MKILVFDRSFCPYSYSKTGKDIEKDIEGIEYVSVRKCRKTNKECNDVNCPVENLPYKLKGISQYEKGWNACIEEILKNRPDRKKY